MARAMASSIWVRGPDSASVLSTPSPGRTAQRLQLLGGQVLRSLRGHEQQLADPLGSRIGDRGEAIGGIVLIDVGIAIATGTL